MYRKTIEERLEELGSSLDGLSSEDAKLRLKEDGPNQIEEEEPQSVIANFFSNFKDLMILILLLAAAVSFVLDEKWDAIIILAIVILNAIISTFQYARAKGALAALKELSTPNTLVMRDGRALSIPASEVVRGDIVLLEAGNIVPADGRLVESYNLQVNESALTGESLPVDKTVDLDTDENIPLAERINMVYASTPVSYGRGKFLVTATGMNTEIGKIAFMLLKDEEKRTPLQKRLDNLTKVLSVVVAIVAVAIFGIGLMQKRPLHEMFFTSISVAVAAIPEGLPAVIAIVLALGVQRLSKKNAVVSNLPSVETLGSASVICTDKTGTLTQNIMSVNKVASFADSNEELIRAVVLNNDVQISEDGSHLGDPTEAALVNYAISEKADLDEIKEEFPRVGEIPFDSTRKLMSTLHRTDDGFVQYVKGGLDEVLTRCIKVAKGNQTPEITSQMRYLINEKNEEMAGAGLRVIAVAKASRNSEEDLHEEGLTFLGLLGLIDPPRETAKESIRLCRRAGIIPVMITGDHLTTAQSIAKELGIYDPEEGHKVISGKELEKMDDQKLESEIEHFRVYARVAPEQKFRIVNAWQSKGHVVAMTGDGVNDAPALKKSDIGVAMGITGSDVSRSAADVVLMDDDFSTIVTAVEEGRGIFENIRRTVGYLLSCNLGELLLILATVALGMPLPLLPVQILWVNLVSDALPALALGVEPSETSAMVRPPRPIDEGIITRKKAFLIVFEGLMIAGIAFVAYQFGMVESLDKARTMSFLTIGFSQLIHAFNARSQGSIFNRNLFANRIFYLAVIVSGVMLAVVSLVPMLQKLFKVVTLDPAQWLFVAGLSVIPLVVSEIRKIFIQG